MKLLADLHTHSKNSRFGHGKNTIEEMAIEANEIGLVEIGITDHGYSHFFRTTKQKIKQARKIVDDINSWSKTKVLLGVEADIINENGDIDIDNERLSMLDILIVGYHKLIVTDFANFFGKTKKTEAAKRKCTNAFINAINKYPVTIVSHLDSILTTDLYEVGKACKERGTLIEINNRHTKWNEKQVEELLASGCLFVLSSDAHSRNSVGEVGKAMELITKYKIPSERVVNVEFDDSEKSEDNLRYSAYMSVYEKLAKEKREKEEIIETKQKTEITGKLSDEMEQALQKIAKETGVEYTGYKQESVEDSYVSDFSGDEARLIALAEEYIKNHKIDNIDAENDKIKNVDGDESLDNYVFNDDHPLLKNNDTFKDRFQPLSDIAGAVDKYDTSTNFDNLKKLQGEEIAQKPVVPEIVEAPKVEAIEKPVEKKEVDERFTNIKIEPETQNLSVYEQMNKSSNVDDLKKLMTENNSQPAQETKPVQEQVFKKVEPENFMDSITQTKLVGNAQKKQEEPAKKPEKQKPAAQNINRRGAFIVVDNLLDSDKK